MVAPKKHKRKTKPAAQPPAQTAQTVRATSRAQLERWLPVAGALSALAISLAIYLLRLDRVAGMVVDDAWYILLAKALASGQGYTLINSPTPGIVPFYSPGFPALLAIFYRLGPEFPANIWLLKAVSVTAMLGAGAVAFYYFRRERALTVPLALGLGVAVTLYPALVFFATSTVMSECVFTLALLASIAVIERIAQRGAASWRLVTAGAALVSFAFLTRPAGLGLLAGSIIYLLKMRRLKSAAIFAAVIALLIGPWLIYARLHAPTAEQRAEQGGNIVESYQSQFWQRVAGQPLHGTIKAEEIPERVWNNLSEIGRYDIGAIFFYSLYRPLEPGEPMRIAREAAYVSLFLTGLALAGFIHLLRQRLTLAEIVVPLSLTVSAAWGWEQFRLLLPLAPFVYFYVLAGVRAVIVWLRHLYASPDPRAGLVTMTVIIWAVVALELQSHARYLERKNDPSPAYGLQWVRRFAENEAFVRYLGEQLPSQGVIATQNPALVHLYTGRKTVASDNPAGTWPVWERIGVRYLARTSAYPLPPPDAAESRYQLSYQMPGSLNLRLVDLGPPGARPVWGEK